MTKNQHKQDDPNSMDNRHWFLIMINSIYYLLGMTQYLYASILISYVLILYQKALWTDYSIIALNVTAFIIGLIQVGYLRRKNRLIDYNTRLSETNDIDVAMENHKQKHKKNGKRTD